MRRPERYRNFARGQWAESGIRKVMRAFVIGVGSLMLHAPAIAQTRDEIADLPIGEVRALAEQGNGLAQMRLGLSYLVGLDVPEDAAEAVRWYRRAADQGYADAQKSLGDR